MGDSAGTTPCSGLRNDRELIPFPTVRKTPSIRGRCRFLDREIASLGSRIAIWTISLRFFSPPEKETDIDRAFEA